MKYLGADYMTKKLKIIAITIIFTISTLFPFLTETKANAANYSAQILTYYTTTYPGNRTYSDYPTKYVYSDGTSVHTSSTLPTSARWATSQMISLSVRTASIPFSPAIRREFLLSRRSQS